MNSTPVVAAILLALMQVFSTALVVWIAFHHIHLLNRVDQQEHARLKLLVARYQEQARQSGLDPVT